MFVSGDSFVSNVKRQHILESIVLVGLKIRSVYVGLNTHSLHCLQNSTRRLNRAISLYNSKGEAKNVRNGDKIWHIIFTTLLPSCGDCWV